MLEQDDIPMEMVGDVGSAHLDLAQSRWRGICPGCQRTIDAKLEFIGQRVQCKCRQSFVFPWWNPIASSIPEPFGNIVFSTQESDLHGEATSSCMTKCLREFRGHSGAVESVVFSPDNRRLLSGSADQTIRFWDVSSGQEILPSLPIDSGSVNSVCFSKTGNYFLSGGDTGVPKLWREQSPLYEFPKSGEGKITMLAISQNNEWLALSKDDGTISVWSTKTRQRIWEIEYLSVPSDPMSNLFIATSCCFSLDDKQLFVTGGKTLRSILPETGQITREYTGPTNWTYSAQVSSNGVLVLASSDDGSIWVWDAKTTRPVQTLQGHKDMIHTACFTNDGTHVLSGSFDKTARLWEVASGREIYRFEGHEDCVHSVGLSSDERFFFTGSYDTTIKLWPNPLKQ